MTWMRNTFETGIADGTAITVANSDDGTAGTAFADVDKTNNGVVEFDTARFYEGARSMRVLTGNLAGDAGMCSVSWLWSRTEAWYRFFINPDSLGSNQGSFIFSCNDGGDSRLASVHMHSDRNLRLRDSSDVLIATAATTIPLDAWSRVELRVQHSTTAGLMVMRIYTDPDGTVEDDEVTASGANLGNACARVRFGGTRSGLSYPDAIFNMDDLAASDEGWIGAAEPGAGGGGGGGQGSFPIGMLPS